MVEAMSEVLQEFLDEINEDWFDTLMERVFDWTENNPNAVSSEIVEIAKTAFESSVGELLFEALRDRTDPGREAAKSESPHL